jgi:O-antigen ligase
MLHAFDARLSRVSRCELTGRDVQILTGLGLSLGLFYLGSHALSLAMVLAGLLGFAMLAFFRPRLGLLYVPATVPLYLMPAIIPELHSASGRSFMLPVHEVALLLVIAAWFARGAWRLYSHEAQRPHGIVAGGELAQVPILFGWRQVPVALFLVSGLVGLALAIVDGPALRELRWLVLEPVAFYGLARFYLAHPLYGRPYARLLAGALLTAGGAVALLGLLQFAGLDLVPALGAKQCECDNIMAYGAARRVSSVYGSPNNLAMLLERVWPIAAALAAHTAAERAAGERESRRRVLGWSALAGLCIAGVVVSFSRGAWLGSVAALGVLLLVLGPRRTGLVARLHSPAVIAVAAAALVLGGAMIMLRSDSLADGSSVRWLLWQEAAGYLARHPLGIGLDQFLYYHQPESGRSLMAPALLGTPVEHVSHPHNFVLDILLRAGPIGFVAMAWLLVRFYRLAADSLRMPGRSPLVVGAVAAMTAGLAHGLVDQFYFVPDLAFSFWLLLALVEQAGQGAKQR